MTVYEKLAVLARGIKPGGKNTFSNSYANRCKPGLCYKQLKLPISLVCALLSRRPMPLFKLPSCDLGVEG